MEPLRLLKKSIRDPAVLVASFGASLAALALPFGMIQIYDRIIPNKGYATLAAIGIIVVCAVLVEGILRMARENILGRAGARFEVDAYRKTIRALLEEQLGSAGRNSEGELMTKFTSIDRLRDLHTGATSSAMLDLPVAALFLLFVFAISPVISIVMIIILMLSFLRLRIYRKRVCGLHHHRQEIESRRQSYLAEILDKVDTVRALAIEDQMQRRYERLLSRSAEITCEMTQVVQAAKSFTASIGVASPLIASSIGAYIYSLEKMTVGSLAAVMILTGRIVQPILQFEAYVAGADNARVAAEDYRFLVDRPRQPSGDRPLHIVESLELVNASSVPHSDGGICFNNVSLRLELGSCTRITAPSAAHASAFLRLLAGEYELAKGQLLVNGIEIAEYQLAQRVAAIRLFTAQHHLLVGRLIENLTNFNEIDLRSDAMRLSSEIGLDKHIAGTSEGYEMSVGGSGQGSLPRSLVDAAGIVAGLVVEPSVILFDEANASLDPEMDIRLRTMLEERLSYSIIVIISNRPSFARLAEQEIDITHWMGRSDLTDHPREMAGL